ncbi:putative amidoligase enzyme-domain-containing protein [Daldinia decipiens]|uniref:putative amidoligase enzyme-domain-containing protein n=1 Tax=Daldinia decipiens TaxID=326647 RepID=UPI0020C2AFEE|nr:putative amidoligase enzyme-domain-containing protein [Daldinia decipiens]KAI1659874.1 putative amidoligase enzyme-domain-containing protein [Daldinia decipiens]
MVNTRAAAVVLSALALVSAQANSNSTFKIDPTEVDISDRVNWCQGQQDSCSTICGSVVQNGCSVDTLDFQCVCQGGNEPDMNEFMNTVPWFVCERLQSDCITQNENNAAGQKNCTSTFGDKCGTEDVDKHKGEGSVSSTSSSSAAPSGTATPASSAAPSSSSEAAAVPTHIQYLGNGAAAVALGMKIALSGVVFDISNPEMASSNEFTVPVGTCHSFGIELEFLVAYLPNNEPDPNETEAHLLPPLLRVDTSNYKATMEIRESIRATLRANGVPVSEARSSYTASADSTRDESPYRLREKKKWNVALDSSLGERFIDKYKWQAIEIQSPALWATDESFKEIEYVTNVLTYNYRLRVNPTCGFHVHIGNGTDFFTGQEIRRLGMFLWAADPILSRLHPPWRRVHSYSASVRYHSRLATEGITSKDVRKELDSWLSTDDPIAITKFSYTTREEEAFGSVERWEAYAKWRNRVGPFITLRDDIGNASTEDSPDQSPSDPEPSLLPSWEAVEVIGRHLREQEREKDVPPEDHTLHRNIGWIRWDALQDTKVIEHVHFLCKDRFGTTNPTELDTFDQIQLVVLAQCAFMYGSSIKDIDDEKFYKVLLASAPYLEAARFGWQYDPSANNFFLASSTVGPILSKPRPKKEERIDSPYIIRKWQNIVELMEPDKDDDRPSFSEYNEAIQTNEGISSLFEKFRSRADSPYSQYQRDMPSPPHFDFSPTPSPTTTIALSSSPDTPEPKSSPLDPNPEPLPKIPSSNESSNDSSPKPLKRVSNTQFSPSPPSVDVESEDEDESWPPKMRPHDVNKITALYQCEVAKYVTVPDAMWDRIGWVPSILNPVPDPAGEDAKNDPIFSNAFRYENSAAIKAHPITSGIQGIANLAACDSAVAVATLLEGPFCRRLNYNFKHYSAPALTDDREEGFMSANSRTIEFREAAGTLDAKWISTWARVTTGLVRFARRASPVDFLAVLDRLIEQEERDIAIKAAKANRTYDPADYREEDRYDVCDLLEDVGLFADAALIRRREQERGPPR